MKRRLGLRLGGGVLTVGVAAAIGFALVRMAAGPAGAACQTADAMTKNFLTLYPTGGPVARFDGERGGKVMQGLAIDGDGDEVVFLYSGDGPVTGARGRYMYLILDSADCILHNDWVDGDTFDRVSPPQ